ncbi:hypothetical protein CKO27_20990 [Thiocystis violacea]|nr:hypothetical protein [Thiocystis violacea]
MRVAAPTWMMAAMQLFQFANKVCLTLRIGKARLDEMTHDIFMVIGFSEDMAVRFDVVILGESNDQVAFVLHDVLLKQATAQYERTGGVIVML